MEISILFIDGGDLLTFITVLERNFTVAFQPTLGLCAGVALEFRPLALPSLTN